MSGLSYFMHKLRSIRRRVLILVSLVYLLSSGLSSLWIYYEVSEEVDELFDAEMVQQAKTLAAFVQGHGLHEQGQVIVAALDAHEYEERVAYRMQSSDGTYSMSTEGAPDAQAVPFAEGFQLIEADAGTWHTYGMFTELGNFRLLLMQEDGFRAELRTDLVVDTLIPILLILPLMLWLGWIAINRSFTSFGRLATELGQRRPDDYRAFPVTREDEEVVLVKRALNHYLQRIEQTFQREKRFSADAAHELRTPLAALRARLQNLQQPDKKVSPEQLQQTIQSTDRLIYLVESLLALSRAELPPNEHKQFNLAQLLRELIAEQVPRADKRGLHFAVELPRQLMIFSDRGYWQVLLSNLVDNAIKYARPDSTLTISYSPTDRTLTFSNLLVETVSFDVARIGERFYRGNHLDIAGSGLGLSIVANLARQLEVTVNYLRNDDLFEVSITLPTDKTPT